MTIIKPRSYLLIPLAALSFILFPMVASAAGGSLSTNLQKQAKCIKEHRRIVERHERLANQAKWARYKNAEKQYVQALKQTYAWQNHPTKLPQMLPVLDATSKEYRKRSDSLMRSLGITGATVGKTRYGPLDQFDAVLKEFVKLLPKEPESDK